MKVFNWSLIKLRLSNLTQILLKTSKKNLSPEVSGLKGFLYYLVIVCFLSGPTETILMGTSTSFSMNSMYSFSSFGNAS